MLAAASCSLLRSTVRSMKSIPLGTSDLQPSAVALGCMRYNPRDEAHEKELATALDAAVEAGINLFDHADVYGGGACEAFFGRQ